MIPLLLAACATPTDSGKTPGDDTADTAGTDSGTPDTAETGDSGGACGDGTDGTNWYRDADADGHGDPASAELACYAPSGFIAEGDDCVRQRHPSQSVARVVSSISGSAITKAMVDLRRTNFFIVMPRRAGGSPAPL